MGRGSELPPHQLGVWGSAVSSPSGVRGRATEKFAFWIIGCTKSPKTRLVRGGKCPVNLGLLGLGGAPSVPLATPMSSLSNIHHLNISCSSPSVVVMDVFLQSSEQHWNMIGRFFTPNFVLIGRIAGIPSPYLGPPQASHFF